MASSQVKAARETNAMNYKIWQESMQHDKDMFDIENQANIDMWNMQNEYNDPAAQIERLSSAGLNPYLAISSSSASGNASSPPNSASMNKSQAPTMQMASDFVPTWITAADSLSSAMNSFASAFNNAAGGYNTALESPYLPNFFNLRNQGLQVGNAKTVSETKGQDISNKVEEATAEDKIKQAGITTRIMDATLTGLTLSNESQEIINKYLPAEKGIAIMASWEDYFQKCLDSDMKEQDAENHLYQIVLNRLEQEARIKDINASAGLKGAQAYLAGKQADLTDTQNNKEQVELSVLRATAKDVTTTIVAENAARRAEAAYREGEADFNRYLDEGWRHFTREKEAVRDKKRAIRRSTGLSGDLYEFSEDFNHLFNLYSGPFSLSR